METTGDSNLECVIFTGLQASGKSTFFRTVYASDKWVLVSKDLFGRSNKNKQRRQMQQIQEALESGKSVVVDNTNPSIDDRAVIIELAQKYGARITSVFFESDIEKCLERNATREGHSCVPKVAILGANSRLVPPSYVEGFDQIVKVRIDENTDADFAFQCELVEKI